MSIAHWHHLLEKRDIIILASLGGLEPPTYGLGGRRSIH